jgi:HD-like signal output (HDOD) protein
MGQETGKKLNRYGTLLRCLMEPFGKPGIAPVVKPANICPFPISLNELIEYVEKSDISSIKEVIVHLVAVINDPKSSAKDLKSIIERDPPLSARLLKLANSTYYGFRRHISQIQEAIVGIGFDAVKELALSQKVCELFGSGDAVDGYSRKALWEHSIATALCAKYIYMREFRDPGEIAYSAGLLHNIGIIVEDQYLQNALRQALHHARDNRLDLYESEKKIFGFNHPEIGYKLADVWGFPKELAAPMGYHHTPENVDEKYRTVSTVVFIADYLVQREEIGYCDSPYTPASRYEHCIASLDLQPKGMDLIAGDVQAEIEKMKINGWFS